MESFQNQNNKPLSLTSEEQAKFDAMYEAAETGIAPLVTEESINKELTLVQQPVHVARKNSVPPTSQPPRYRGGNGGMNAMAKWQEENDK